MSPQRYIDGRIPPTAGPLVCAWMEACLAHGEGDYLGRPIRLDPFQRYIENRKWEYDPVTGRLLYDVIVVGLPKGNAKTALFGMDADARLAGPVAPISPKIVLTAAAWKQTRELFGVANLGLKGGPLYRAGLFTDDELLADRIILPGGRQGLIERKAAVAGTSDGGKETDHYADEVHEYVTERQASQWALYRRALAKRSPRAVLPGGQVLIGHQQSAISTAGTSMDSLLGELYAKGVRIAKGEEVDPKFLFLWWEADDSWDLDTEEGIIGATLQANPAAGSFLDLDGIAGLAYTLPRYEWLRYHGNRFVAAPDSWITFERWLAHQHPGELKQPPDGTEVWLGFVGNKARNSTSLMGACWTDVVEDGATVRRAHVFEVRSWDRDPRVTDWQVPRAEVDEALADALARWTVRRLAVNPHRWEREVEDWVTRYGEQLVVVADVEVPSRFAPAVGRFEESFTAGRMTNDGSEAVARHIGNARTKEVRGGVVIEKEHKDSPRLVDRAKAAVLAHDGMTAPAPKAVDRRVRAF